MPRAIGSRRCCVSEKPAAWPSGQDEGDERRMLGVREAGAKDLDRCAGRAPQDQDLVEPERERHPREIEGAGEEGDRGDCRELIFELFGCNECIASGVVVDAPVERQLHQHVVARTSVAGVGVHVRG